MTSLHLAPESQVEAVEDIVGHGTIQDHNGVSITFNKSVLLI